MHPAYDDTMKKGKMKKRNVKDAVDGSVNQREL